MDSKRVSELRVEDSVQGWRPRVRGEMWATLKSLRWDCTAERQKRLDIVNPFLHSPSCRKRGPSIEAARKWEFRSSGVYGPLQMSVGSIPFSLEL